MTYCYSTIVDPIASMASVENSALAGIAEQVQSRLRVVIEALGREKGAAPPTEPEQT